MVTTLTLIWKTPNGSIQQRATSDNVRTAYREALDGISKRFPSETWRGVDFAKASYDAFTMAQNVPLGTACCNAYVIIYRD